VDSRKGKNLEIKNIKKINIGVDNAGDGVCCPVGCNACTDPTLCGTCWGNVPPTGKPIYFLDGTICLKTCPDGKF